MIIVLYWSPSIRLFSPSCHHPTIRKSISVSVSITPTYSSSHHSPVQPGPSPWNCSCHPQQCPCTCQMIAVLSPVTLQPSRVDQSVPLIVVPPLTLRMSLLSCFSSCFSPPTGSSPTPRQASLVLMPVIDPCVIADLRCTIYSPCFKCL